MTEATVQEQVSESKALPTMAEFIAGLEGAPTPEMIVNWKQQAPNHRVRAYAPDAPVGGKRVYILRGLSGLELTAIQNQIQQMATPASNPELETQIACVIKAVLWTNVGHAWKLSDVILRSGAAGTPSSLFTIVSELSDFVDPQKIDALSADL